jgi:hypothetical protein
MKDISNTNLAASLLSLFVPGLGQAIQRRYWGAVAFFVTACILWVIFLGWIIHLWAILDAAFYDPEPEKE